MERNLKTFRQKSNPAVKFALRAGTALKRSPLPSR